MHARSIPEAIARRQSTQSELLLNCAEFALRPAHPGRNLRPWVGDSRGHWVGNTLVVDTTNYSDKIGFRGAGENLHVTERFTRVDADTIRYEFTVDDPTTWTRSWSAEIPMKRMQGPLYEYACTEGNYGLANILRGARAGDAKAEVAAKASRN